MNNGEWEQLVEALTARATDEEAVTNGTVEQLARREGIVAPVMLPEQPRQRASSEGDSAAMSVLKTAGMMTGVGPLVTGLVKIFGGGGDDEPGFSPIPFDMPGSISIDAGVNAQGAVVPVGYSQSGQVREAVQSAKQQPVQIHVNVQAMDSRSFLDHRDEIAQAVRDAMLHSHSLNDVVAEI